MKRVRLILLVIFVIAGCYGQENLGVLDLEIPNSPAFILLDAAPSSVQRPNSSRALGISLLQDIASDGILDDIAVEVTPFWFTSSTKRSALGFYGIKKEGSQMPFSKIKQASFSAAYVTGADSIINISLGARATVFEIKRKSDVEDYLEAYKIALDNIRSDIKLNIEYNKIEKTPQKIDTTMSDEEFKALFLVPYWQRLEAYKQKRREEFKSPIREIVERNPLFALDVAMAYNQRFSEDHFNDNGFGRFGVWGTAAVSLFLDQGKYDYFNIYGFVRYLKGEEQLPSSANESYNAFDVGIKAELDFKKLTIGYEYINRSGDLESYRSAGNIKYQAFENIFLIGSFGNNFEKQDDLITLFGIQWGLNGAAQFLGLD